MDFSILVKKIDSKSLTKRIKITPSGNIGIRIALLISLLGYCFYLWYAYLYNPGWDEEKRKEYISTKEQEIVLDKNKLNAAISSIEERKAKYNSSLVEVPNIFRADHLTKSSE